LILSTFFNNNFNSQKKGVLRQKKRLLFVSQVKKWWKELRPFRRTEKRTDFNICNLSLNLIRGISSNAFFYH